MKQRSLALAGLALISAVSLVVIRQCEADWCFVFAWQRAAHTQSFAECVAQGFPVRESYPRQCAAGQRTFTEDRASPAPEAPVGTANITIISPRSGELTRFPLTVRGEARVFESRLVVRLRNRGDVILFEESVEARSPDTGQWGPYEVRIPPPAGPFTSGFIDAFTYSPKDGTPSDTVTVPIVAASP